MMNKRIYELALQAGFSSWVLNPSKETRSETPELLKNFSELLVKECAKIANIADENKCEDIGGNILTHFGVKE